MCTVLHTSHNALYFTRTVQCSVYCILYSVHTALYCKSILYNVHTTYSAALLLTYVNLFLIFLFSWKLKLLDLCPHSKSWRLRLHKVVGIIFISIHYPKTKVILNLLVRTKYRFLDVYSDKNSLAIIYICFKMHSLKYVGI